VSNQRERDLLAFEVRASKLDDSELFRIVWMESPYPGYYYVLRVFQSGEASLVCDVPDWARQGVGAMKLSPEVLADVAGRLGKLGDFSRLTVSASDPNATYVAFSYFDGKVARKYRFSGAMPADIERIVRLVATAMEENSRQP
jgi:hypothetical protein